jgi:hypothetical protein
MSRLNFSPFSALHAWRRAALVHLLVCGALPACAGITERPLVTGAPLEATPRPPALEGKGETATVVESRQRLLPTAWDTGTRWFGISYLKNELLAGSQRPQRWVAAAWDPTTQAPLALDIGANEPRLVQLGLDGRISREVQLRFPERRDLFVWQRCAHFRNDLAVMAGGDILLVEPMENVVWRITREGEARVFFGQRMVSGRPPGDVPEEDPEGVNAWPWGIAVSPKGDVLMTSATAVWKYTPGGAVEIIAGHPDRPPLEGKLETKDETRDLNLRPPATATRLGRLRAIAAAPDGRILVGSGTDEDEPGSIRAIFPDGTLHTLYEGVAVYALAVTTRNEVVFAGRDRRVRRLEPDGRVVLLSRDPGLNDGFAPAEDPSPLCDGAARLSRLREPLNLVATPGGGVLVLDCFERLLYLPAGQNDKAMAEQAGSWLAALRQGEPEPTGMRRARELLARAAAAPPSGIAPEEPAADLDLPILTQCALKAVQEASRMEARRPLKLDPPPGLLAPGATHTFRPAFWGRNWIPNCFWSITHDSRLVEPGPGSGVCLEPGADGSLTFSAAGWAEAATFKLRASCDGAYDTVTIQVLPQAAPSSPGLSAPGPGLAAAPLPGPRRVAGKGHEVPAADPWRPRIWKAPWDTLTRREGGECKALPGCPELCQMENVAWDPSADVRSILAVTRVGAHHRWVVRVSIDGRITRQEPLLFSHLVNPSFMDIAAHPCGDLFLVEDIDSRIWRLPRGGRLEAILDHSMLPSNHLPLEIAAQADWRRWLGVQGITVTPAGEVAFSETRTNRILKLTPEGIVPVAGRCIALADGLLEGSLDTNELDLPYPATDGLLALPTRLAAAPDGRIVFLDSGRDSVRVLRPDGTLTSLAQIPKPLALAVTSNNDAMVVDQQGWLWRIAPDGRRSLLHGASAATGGPVPFHGPVQLVATPGGGLLVLDGHLQGWWINCGAENPFPAQAVEGIKAADGKGPLAERALETLTRQAQLYPKGRGSAKRPGHAHFSLFGDLVGMSLMPVDQLLEVAHYLEDEALNRAIEARCALMELKEHLPGIALPEG